jgi:hypothetical protein
MSDNRNPDPNESEERQFFYVDSTPVVRLVTAYACDGVPGYWYCPEVGVSAAEDRNLFRDRVDAYDVAHARAKAKLDEAQANLNRIEAERWA